MASNKKKKEAKKMRQYLVQFFFLVRVIFDWFVDLVFYFIYRKTERVILPPLKHQFLSWSALELAAKIRNKSLSCETVVRAFVERAKEVNAVLNAIVDERFDDAIQDAIAVDKYLAETDATQEQIKKNKPLLGVPFTNKESTSAKGMMFSFGLVSRKGVKASEDADIVTKIKDSGAILLGVTNVPELNLWTETRNYNYGQTVNPYDTRRTVGGSSGGEAAIIAACGSPIGIGTDIGGSIRMPAFFCGIFGHKPTAGLINTRGMTFRTGEEKDTMVSAGAMSRHPEDMAPFLSLLIGPHNSARLRLDTPVDMKKLKYYYVDDPGDMRVSPLSSDVKKTIQKAVEHLALVSGSTVEPIWFSGFKYSLSLWRHAMTKEPGDFALDLGNRQSKVWWLSELQKMVMGKCDHTLPTVLRLIDLDVLPPTNDKWAENETNRLRNEINSLLGDDGVLLFASSPVTAPYHYAQFFRPYNFAYWAIFNALKLPATQVPCGLSPHGLPLGLQVVGGTNQDRLTMAVGAELGRAFGGWVPPFGSSSG